MWGQNCKRAPDPLSALGAANLPGLSDVLGYCGGLLTLQLKPVMLGRFPDCSGCSIVYENIASRVLGERQFNLKACCHPTRVDFAVLMPLLLPKGCPKLGSAPLRCLCTLGVGWTRGLNPPLAAQGLEQTKGRAGEMGGLLYSSSHLPLWC